MTEWDYIFERDWNKYSINAILERKKKDGFFFVSKGLWVSDDAKLIAEYPTWQKAINSKEFKE